MSIIYRVAINTPQEHFASDESVGFGYKSILTRLAVIPSYFSDWAVSASDTTVNKRVLSVQVDEPDGRATYARKTIYADYTTDQGSWFFNTTTQTIYINFNVPLPVISSILIGIAEGYSNGTVQYIDGIEYLPLLGSSFTIDKEVDALGENKMSFITQNIDLVNTGDEMEKFISSPPPGNLATLSYMESDGTETEFYTGFVKSDAFTTDVYTQSLQDIREKENVLCPSTLFTVDKYPDIDDNLLNKVIPEGYGYRKSVPCYPLNTNGSGDVRYKFATDATDIVAAYYKDDDDAWQLATIVIDNTSIGEFTLATAVARNGDAVRNVKAEVTLRSTANPADMISDMNSRYGGTNYDSTGYDTTEWPVEGAKLADISLYMDSSKNLFEWFELMQSGSSINFVYDITGAGVRTLRVDEDEREPVFRFDELKLLNSDRPVNRNFDEYQSSLTIKHSFSDIDETWEVVTDTTYETAALRRYGYKKVQEQETLLSSEANATIRALRYAEDLSIVRQKYYVVMKIDNAALFGLKMYDTGIVNLSYGNRGYFGWKRVKIIGRSIDPATETISFFMRETVDQTIPMTAKYLMDTNGYPLLDTNNDFICATSGTVWEAT